MPPSRLSTLVNDRHAALGDIAAFLDGLDPRARWKELAVLDRPTQRTLYEKASAGAPLTLDDFVPAGTPARKEVVHKGRNTLPGIDRLRFFEKRFCRPEEGGERLFGYNEGMTRKVIGPGYFVAIPTKGRPTWEARGAVVVDYFQVPDSAVVDGWPKVIANSVGLQLLVYHHMRDFMRRVSEGVSISAAYRDEKPLDQYFLLHRQD